MDGILSAHEIQTLGFAWPKFAVIEKNCVKTGDRIDLIQTKSKLCESRDFYQRQINAAYNFKQRTGADYSDFTDRFDDITRSHRELKQAISHIEEILKTLEKD